MNHCQTTYLRAFAVILIFFSPAGKLSADDIAGIILPFKEVVISSPVQEIIREVLVKEGDLVEEGQEIVRLANERELLDVRQSEELIKQREFESKGADTLHSEEMASQEFALRKRTELELARLQLELAEVRLAEKSIRSPISGVVVKKHKESGEAVDRVERILEIVDVSQVFLQVFLPPESAVNLQEGTMVPVTVAGSQANADPRAAAISFIDPRIDAASGLIRIKLLLENGDGSLRAGMRAHADFSGLRQDLSGR